MNAARKMHLAQEQLNVIKNAFDQVEIEGASGTLSGKITDYSSNLAISGTIVNSMQNAPVPFMADRVTIDISGEYSVSLEYTRYKYIIGITATGYEQFFAMQTVEENEDKRMDVALVRPGTSSSSIEVRSAYNNWCYFEPTARLEYAS